jgi:hypothetical protein
MPKPGKNSYKAGCLKKTVEADIQYEEAPIPREFKRRGLKAVGAVETENQVKQQGLGKLPPSNKNANANNNGCGCDPSGCLGGLKK